jgi:trimethylamine---corrinoid protein Co-methyltransferase
LTLKTISLLDEDTLLRIQASSLRLLEEVGMAVGDAGCADLLVRGGALRVGESNVVRLPAAMVLEAVSQLSGVYELADLHGKRTPLPCPCPLPGSRLKMPAYLEHGAAESRQVRRQDVINLARVAAALPKIGWSVVIDCPTSDGNPAIDLVDSLGMAYAITGQPLMTAPTTEEGLRMSIDLALAASGAGSIAQFPNLFVCVNTTSPLQMAPEECRILRCAVENGVPIDVEPMTVAGASTPFTLAGTLMVETAEVLFMLCLANTVHPGARVMESTVGSILNMKAPNISLAAPEAMLLASAEAAMTRLHGLPVLRMGGYSDAYYPDIQAGIEKTAFTLMIALSRADLVLMGGPLNNAAHQSCESAVLDHDIWELVERCTTEIRVDEDTLAYENVARVGIGGSHVETEHTLRWLRSGEHYYGGSYNRSGRSGRENSMLERAHQRVERILKKPLTCLAPPEVIERMRDCIEDQAKAAGVAAPPWPIP